MELITKHKCISLRISESEKDILKLIADGKTLSYTIRQLIRKEAQGLN